jgi:uncharacterized membrane protein (UPF0127 family)
MGARLVARNVTRGTALAECGRVADGAVSRLVGLLRDTQLAHGDGLWIVPCNSIHSFGMKFIFDAIFLDKQQRVVHLMREMKPWRMSPLKFAAHSVLELPAGLIAASATELGDQLEMKKEPDSKVRSS